MDSIVVQVAEALTRIAYVGPFQDGVVVSRSYVARHDLQTLQVGLLYVTVIPIGWQESDDTRTTDSDVISCAVSFQYKVKDPTDTAQVDEVLLAYQVNTNRLRDLSGDDLLGLDAEMIDSKPGSLYETDHLHQHSVVTSWSTVEVTVPRSRTR